jgi:heptosyltransferase II
MAPGAEYGPAKRWPHFGGLAVLLDRPVILLGSAKEADLCEAIRGQAPAQSRNLAGKTSLLEAFALIAGAGNVVSNDSGLMHVAAAFGVPQVALFGSSSPLHTPPLNTNAKVVWLKQDPAYLPPLDCAPCFQRECPLGHFRCLNDVSPERVKALL